jgi:hypothetical protein
VRDCLRPLNPEKTPEDLEQFIDSQIAAGYSPNMQFVARFGDRFGAEVVVTTVVAHALCEAIINAILALGLASRGQEELFSILESANLKEKWTVVPRTFLPAYSLPRSDAQYEALSLLCKKRNAFVHSKITLKNEETILVEGSNSGPMSLDVASRKLMKRFLNLPYELHSQLCSQIDDLSLRHAVEHLLGSRRPLTE